MNLLPCSSAVTPTHPTVKELLNQRQQQAGLSLWEIAQGIADLRKEGTANTYYGAVKKVFAQPDEAKWKTLRDIWRVLGVEAETAIAIAANAATKPNPS